VEAEGAVPFEQPIISLARRKRTAWSERSFGRRCRSAEEKRIATGSKNCQEQSRHPRCHRQRKSLPIASNDAGDSERAWIMPPATGVHAFVAGLKIPLLVAAAPGRSARHQYSFRQSIPEECPLRAVPKKK